MALFPIVAAGVSALFAVVLLRQFSARRRLPHLAWGLALAMFTIASLVLAWAVADEWDATLYRIFWLFGALLNVPWLALGSIALVTGRLTRGLATLVVVAASGYGVAAVAKADPDRAQLAAADGVPRGRLVWDADPTLVDLARWYSIVAWIVVVAIAVLSSRPRRGVRPPAERARGNWLIAIGVSIVAIGGFALSRIGQGAAFSVTLAVGVIVMFAGFLLASRAPRYVVEDPGESPT